MDDTRKIMGVMADAANPDEVIVELDNGVTVVLSLKPKFGEAKFAQIKELCLPKTDGARVYWSNGASLTVGEIMEMLRAGGGSCGGGDVLNGQAKAARAEKA